MNSDGGYLVDPQTAETIKSVLNATASIRSIASVVNVDATSYDVLVDHTDLARAGRMRPRPRDRDCDAADRSHFHPPARAERVAQGIAASAG